MSFVCTRPNRFSLRSAFVVILLLVCAHPGPPAFADLPEIAWTEDFATDPVVGNRFSVSPVSASYRFSYDPLQTLLTAHYDTSQPTAWYLRPLGRNLDRYSDFEFSLTFRIQSGNFSADPNGFAQIAWGLINSQTTGPDRAGNTPGLYAFDCLTFDYFPNVSPLWGGPTICSTVIYSDDGDGSFPTMSFAQYQEGMIDAGDETIAVDTVYTARVVYNGFAQVATVKIREGDRFLSINAEGSGGLGGQDGDPTTIQTFATAAAPDDFNVDSFAIAAWIDSYCTQASVIADVDIFHAEFFVPPVRLGDMNHDALIDGRDIEPFVRALLSPNPDSGAIARGDFIGDGTLDIADVQPFVSRLMQP